MTTTVYKGFLQTKKPEGKPNAVFLSTEEEPFIDVLASKFDKKFISVEYYLTNQEVTNKEAAALYLNQMMKTAGNTPEEWCDNADMGGIFWENGKTTNMGSMLVDVLEANIGKYLILEFI